MAGFILILNGYQGISSGTVLIGKYKAIIPESERVGWQHSILNRHKTAFHIPATTVGVMTNQRKDDPELPLLKEFRIW